MIRCIYFYKTTWRHQHVSPTWSSCPLSLRQYGRNYKALRIFFSRSLPIRNAQNKCDGTEVVPKIDTHLTISATDPSGIHIPVFVTKGDITIPLLISTPEVPIIIPIIVPFVLQSLSNVQDVISGRLLRQNRHDVHQLFHSLTVPTAPENYSIKLR
jgi:hypothetical protein